MKQACFTLTEADRHRRLGRPPSPDLDLLLETDHAGDTTNLEVREWKAILGRFGEANKLAALGARQGSVRVHRTVRIPTPSEHTCNFVIWMCVPSIPAA